jgi:hypothetical protein
LGPMLGKSLSGIRNLDPDLESQVKI